MADSKIIVTSSDSNNRLVQKTIPNINPNANNVKLKAFGQKLTALTDNTLSKVERVDKTDITSAVEKLTPSVKISNNVKNIPYSSAIAGQGYSLDVVGDGNFSIVRSDDSGWTTGIRKGSSGLWRLLVGKPIDGTESFMTVPHDIIIRTEETDTYKAGEFVIQIVADT